LKRFEVKLLGVGGQGIRMAGEILGRAATNDGKFATHWQSYGVETRGGPSTSEVVVSDEKIVYPRVTFADIMAATDRAVLRRHIHELKPGGLLLVDLDLVGDEILRGDVQIRKIPMAKIANELGQRMVVNMVMLGALQGLTEIVTKDIFLKTIRESVPNSMEEVNVKAFLIGMEKAKIGDVTGKYE